MKIENKEGALGVTNQILFSFKFILYLLNACKIVRLQKLLKIFKKIIKQKTLPHVLGQFSPFFVPLFPDLSVDPLKH